MTEQASEIATLKAENEKLAAMAAKIDVLEKALATVQDKLNGLQNGYYSSENSRPPRGRDGRRE